MPIVTLTTDLGTKDFYAGVLKGYIKALSPQVHIIDLSHRISPFNILEGAYTIRNAYPNFPEGSIHVISVDSSDRQDGRILLVSRKGQYFIMPDNGLIALVFDHSPGTVYQLDKAQGKGDPFNETVALAVQVLAGEGDLNSIGKETTQFQQRTSLQPVVSGTVIRGTIIHVDGFDNAVVNISRQLFDEVIGDKPFEIIFNRNFISEIVKHYADVPEGEKLCRFNTAGMLEIAMNKGKAASLLGLQNGGSVIIDFG